ncbi:MAG TPA: pyruvate formate lyase family protein [Mobilitalea sp.]|nr:pyruvate formate lyase family protein [Mobilitalea sp.]
MKRIEKYLALFRESMSKNEIYIPSRGLLAGWHTRCDKGSFLWEMFEYDNMHYPLGDAFFQYSIAGIIQKAEAAHDDINTEEGYLQAVREVYKEILSYIEKHADLAKIMSEETSIKDEKIRLEEISNNCKVLTQGAPETFAQALQLFWFMYVIRNPFGSGCIGRLDQKLFPFYENEKKKGLINKEKVIEMIIEFYTKLNEMGTGDTLRNLMLSGQDAKGNDETNEVTYLFLEAYEKLGDAEPHLNVRLHKKSPEKLIKMCLELLGTGKGQPTIYFDDNIIPAMEQAGICHDLACRYTNDGCTETVIDGASSITFLQHEMVKTVELTLFNGQENPSIYPVKMKKSKRYGPTMEPRTALVLGYESGDVSMMESFDEVYSAFERQLTFQITEWLQLIDRKIEADEEYTVTSPLVGGSLKLCLESGRDPLRGGGFIVGNYQLLSGSIGTAADCLMGIQSAVYDNKWCTMKELVDALACDFKGQEVLRQRLLHCPKYGNGEEQVDALAARIASKFIEIVNGYRNEKGKRVWPGLYDIDFKISANITGATPDGRKFRDPIGEHCSPTPGMAKKGPTAILESASKLPMRDGYASSPLHLTLDKGSFIMGAEKDKILYSMLLVAREQGIPVLNISMYSREELIEAKKHPEQYPDLVVRVWGFNARFVELDEELQEHIISRIS